MFNPLPRYSNTSTGLNSLYSNTSGSDNTATGFFALYYNSTGSFNTASGHYALSDNIGGSYNTATGDFALNQNENSHNTANGYSAGSYNDNNTYCSFFGNDADQTVSTDFTNSMALGNTSRITASNQVRIGNTAVTSIGGYASWTNISDGRYKKNIKQDVPGLEFINQLKPITYNLDITGVRKFLGEDKSIEENMKDANGKPVAHEKNAEADALIQQAVATKEEIIYTGFIAQDVEAAAKKLNYDFSGVDKPQDENGLYGLRYSEFVVPLVKAVQELSKINDEKDEKIISLEQRLAKLEAMMNVQQATTNQKLQTNLSSASLEQNIPNPFQNTTTINYTLPQQYSSAKILITDKSGKVLKEINLSGNGKGSIRVDATALSSGAYQYTLYIDNKIIASKQMEHIH